MSLALPWELIERVIYHSSDNFTLWSFTLTCRDLNPYSTIVLFGRVSLKNREQSFSLFDVLKAKPHLRCVVTSITLPPNEFSPCPSLRVLGNLREIRFVNSGAGAEFHPSVLKLCRFWGGNIESLSLNELRFPSFSAFSTILLLFPRIKSLSCSNVKDAFHKRPLEMEQDRAEQRVSQRMHHLERLTVQVNHDVTLQSLRLLGLLRNAAQQAVQRLELDLYTVCPDMHPPDLVADIFLGPSPSSSWVTLTSLTLRIALSKTQSAIEQVVKIMNGLGRPAKLREVTVDLIFPTITLLDIVALSPRKYLELKALLQHFSQANIRLSPHHPINFRTRNFWREHVERCLPLETPARGAVPVTLRYTYSGKFGHDSRITTSIVTSMDGRWAATGSDDDTIIIWDLHNGFIAQEWLVRTIPDGTRSPALPGGLQSGYPPHLNFLAFSPSSQHLMSMGAMSGVTVWDLHQGARKVVSLGDDDDFEVLRGCALSPDGSFIAAYSSDSVVRIWETSTFRQMHHLDSIYTGDVLAISPDGRWILIGRDGFAYIHDINSGKLRTILQYPNGSIVCGAFDQSSARVVTGFKWSDSMIIIWDVETGKKCGINDRGLRADILAASCQGISFSPDGKLIHSWSTNWKDPGFRTRIWDASNGHLLNCSDTRNFRALSPSCFSPCSRYVASISTYGSVILWRATDGSRFAEIFGNGSPVEHIAVSPDGEVLCCGCKDGSVFFRQLCDFVPV